MSTETTEKIEISICMGSSCFARGNNHNVETIQNYILSHDLEEVVLLKGNLCEGACENGPNIHINEKLCSCDVAKVITYLSQFVKK